MQTDQWRVVSDQYSCPVVMRGSDKEGDLEIVAKCYGIEGHSAESIAALVAAAPELLAACRLMVALEDSDVHPADTRWKQSRKDMRSAIAKCYGIEGHSAESIAALVAAAPDLLAALKQAVSAITYLLSNDDDDPGYADTLNTLAAAIAKAEGRPS